MGVDQTRAGKILARVNEEIEVTLYAHKGQKSVFVGKFRSLEAAAQKVDEMEAATTSSGDEISSMQPSERTPEKLLKQGFWPETYWARAVDGKGKEFKYTELVWEPMDIGSKIRDPNNKTGSLELDPSDLGGGRTWGSWPSAGH